jgi:uncharacterized membrane protein affecting hemolysin expression
MPCLTPGSYTISILTVIRLARTTYLQVECPYRQAQEEVEEEVKEEEEEEEEDEEEEEEKEGGG